MSASVLFVGKAGSLEANSAMAEWRRIICSLRQHISESATLGDETWTGAFAEPARMKKGSPFSTAQGSTAQSVYAEVAESVERGSHEQAATNEAQILLQVHLAELGIKTGR